MLNLHLLLTALFTIKIPFVIVHYYFYIGKRYRERSGNHELVTFAVNNQGSRQFVIIKITSNYYF